VTRKARSRLASSRAGYHGQGEAGRDPATRENNPSSAPALTPPTYPRPPPSEGLLDKAEVCELVGKSYQCLWLWMRQGKFPRSRLVGTRPMWLRNEIEEWIASLPLVRLKGDAP